MKESSMFGSNWNSILQYFQVTEYHKKIKKPMSLDMVRRKLDANDYNSLKEIVSDIRLIFKNAYDFNRVSSSARHSCQHIIFLTSLPPSRIMSPSER